MDEEQAEVFKQWAVLELFGHQRLVGSVTEMTIAGQGFIRVDVPAVKERPGFTRFFGPSAVYAISPIAEELARAYAAAHDQAPIAAYEVRQLLAETRQPRLIDDEEDQDDN